MNEKKGFELIEFVIAVAVTGIIAAIVMPNFVKLEAQSDQDKTKSELKAGFNAAKESFAEKDEYDKSYDEVGFKPEPGNRYEYNYNEEETEDSEVSQIGPPAEIKNIEKMTTRTENLERVSREDRRDVVRPRQEKPKTCP